MKRKKIAVTGGAGFLGSHVVQMLLDRNYSVNVIDNFSNGKMMHLDTLTDNPHLNIIRGDILNKKAVQDAFSDCQCVIHLAVLGLRESIKHPKHVTDVIVDGTLNCLEIARKNHIELFLNCSSSEVYGTAQYIPMDEAHPLNPETPYAAAKVAQDKLVSSYGRTYGLPWTTIRPFNMYGSNSHWQGCRGELIPRMIVRILNRDPVVIFGDGSQTRDFLFVEDAAQAIMTLLESKQCLYHQINVSSGKETSVRYIAEFICDYFGLSKQKYIQINPARPGDVKRHLGDHSKAKEMFGFTPQTSLDEGLCKTIKWFQSLLIEPKKMEAQESLINWV